VHVLVIKRERVRIF